MKHARGGIDPMKLLLAAFLAAHALLHISYLTPPPPRTASGPEWPFELTNSWLVTVLQLDPAPVRALGAALAITTVVLLLGAGMATVGWLVPTSWWTSLVIAGSIASLATLALFFHPWLALGVVIDLVLLWAALIGGWEPSRIG